MTSKELTVHSVRDRRSLKQWNWPGVRVKVRYICEREVTLLQEWRIGGGGKNILQEVAINHIKVEHLNWRSGTKDKKRGLLLGSFAEARFATLFVGT